MTDAICWEIWDEDSWADLDRYHSATAGEAIVGEAIVGGPWATTWDSIQPCQNDTGAISE